MRPVPGVWPSDEAYAYAVAGCVVVVRLGTAVGVGCAGHPAERVVDVGDAGSAGAVAAGVEAAVQLTVGLRHYRGGGGKCFSSNVIKQNKATPPKNIINK